MTLSGAGSSLHMSFDLKCFFEILFYVFECLPAHMLENHMHAVPSEARRGHWMLWNWSYGHL